MDPIRQPSGLGRQQAFPESSRNSHSRRVWCAADGWFWLQWLQFQYISFFNQRGKGCLTGGLPAWGLFVTATEVPFARKEPEKIPAAPQPLPLHHRYTTGLGKRDFSEGQIIGKCTTTPVWLGSVDGTASEPAGGRTVATRTSVWTKAWSTNIKQLQRKKMK